VVASATTQARAGLVLVQNSTYDVALAGTSSGVQISTLTVNGAAQSFTYHGLTITANLSEASLGGGQYQITLDLTAPGDIFPVAHETGAVNIGGLSNPMDLNTPLNLTNAALTFFNGSGAIIISNPSVGDVAQTTPWDGFFPNSTSAGGFGNLGGFDTQDIRIVLSLDTPVPEPSTFVMGGIAVAAGGVWLRRRRLPRSAA
jgi:hypothetical protein